jgi:hypothetical protein
MFGVIADDISLPEIFTIFSANLSKNASFVVI